jgi:TorA maturation chaperone TorD
MSEALRALGVLIEPSCDQHAAIAEALELPPPPSADEHMAVLGLQLPPYGSIYLGAEGMVGGEARDRVAGLFRAAGLPSPCEPDSLSALCGALAALADTDRRTVAPAVDAGSVGLADPGDPAAREALADPTDPRRAVDARVRITRAALYWEHVASWMPPYLAAVRRIGTPFYVAWADTLDAVLAAEAEAVGPLQALPLHLRAAPAPDGSPAGLDALLGVLLAPVQLGAVVTRDDLARGAAALGLGLRAGERRFALRALLAQDAAGVLGWLAAEARRQAAVYGDRSEIARWWRGRAWRGAHWLDGLARDAADRTPAPPA